MPVPASITNLSTTASSNSPPGSESPATLDDYLRAHAAFIAQLRAVIGGTVDPDIPNAVTKQSSASDATPGRVLIVGAFGLGGAPILFTNANSLPATTGFFGYAGAGSNVPSGGQVGDLLLHQYFNLNAIVQTYTMYATGQTYTRAWCVSTWSAWVEVATSANSLAQGQTWQTVTGSRALSTTYTNTTGKPIVVRVLCVSSVLASQMVITVSGVSLISGQSASSGTPAPFSEAIVPAGGTYSAALSAGTPYGLAWQELR